MNINARGVIAVFSGQTSQMVIIHRLTLDENDPAFRFRVFAAGGVLVAIVLPKYVCISASGPGSETSLNEWWHPHSWHTVVCNHESQIWDMGCIGGIGSYSCISTKCAAYFALYGCVGGLIHLAP